MRAILIGLALLGLATPVSAGFYNTIETQPNIPWEKIRAVVSQLRAVAVAPKGRPDPSSLREGYLAQAAYLEKTRKDGTMATLDRVNLGACYLRLGRPRDAIRVLSEGDRGHFLIQVNLAAAYELNGDLELALRHQEMALDMWPTVWATWRGPAQGIGPGETSWYRECERYNLRLLQSRIAESRQGRVTGLVDVDPLFPRLRFIGPGPKGDYEPGGLAQSIRDQIPHNAVAVVLQLVIWKPQDARLYWLLAELLNAHGYVSEAFDIMAELVETGNRFRNLHEHRKVLEPAAKIDRQLRQPHNKYLLFSYFMSIPSTTLAPPGIGTLAYGTSAAAPVLLAQMVERPSIVPMVDPATTVVPAPPPQQMPFNWRHVMVGFAFGFLVAALLGFQWQEWRRRRLLAASEGADAAGALPVRPGDG
jgi:hypothetical protein